MPDEPVRPTVPSPAKWSVPIQPSMRRVGEAPTKEVSRVDRNDIDRALTEVERGLEAGDADMRSFWRIVAAIKRDPTLLEPFADRAAAIDRIAFSKWAFLKVPIWSGTAVMVLGTVLGMFLVLLSYYVSEPANGLFLLVGTAITLVTTHGLAHLVVGVMVGIRFSHWFIGTARRPQPGVKVDYSTYLRTAPKKRARMHAAGAIMTKLIPFAALGPALVIGVQVWVTVLLVALGIGQILTDVLWSVNTSDWKKYRREMRYAG